ncbi:Os10g0540000, partial [Oryza sativa Japonica Group]
CVRKASVGRLAWPSSLTFPTSPTRPPSPPPPPPPHLPSSCRRPIVLDDPSPPKRCRKCEAIVLEAVVAASSSSSSSAATATGSGGGGGGGGGRFLP